MDFVVLRLTFNQMRISSGIFTPVFCDQLGIQTDSVLEKWGCVNFKFIFAWYYKNNVSYKLLIQFLIAFDWCELWFLILMKT